MKYIALLRGINAGKERRIDMKKLKELFESLGYTNVSTYINSGNVFFEMKRARANDIRTTVEKAIKKEFGFDVPVLVKTEREIKKIAAAVPKNWQNDAIQRSDVAYLFPEADTKKTIKELPIKKEFLDMKYVKGALLWRVKREDYNKSHLSKIAGHMLYKSMTVRNVNTARRLANH